MAKKIPLSVSHPDLAAQWHPIKNGSLTPDQVTCGCRTPVWWLYPYDDPETGLHFDFEWVATPNNRTSGRGCPYLSGKAVWPGYNDLASKAPELAKQWHPVKNGSLTPDAVTASSGELVWWLYPYDDPAGRHFDFEWQAKIRDRYTQKQGCPFLSGRRVWPGFNDLASKAPELAKQWHPTKNGELTPETVTPGTNKKVWWRKIIVDPSGQLFDFEWQAFINNRKADGSDCPYTAGKAIVVGVNDLSSVAPALAAEWNYDKNEGLRPADVTRSSDKTVWWKKTFIDSSGKEFVFEWPARIADRKDDASDCPYTAGKKVHDDYNGLSEALKRQWHPTKNGSIRAEDFTSGSEQIVWWLYPYDDPESGLHFDFEWAAGIKTRAADGSDVPFFSGRKIWPGFNDLSSKAPELAKQWHPTKNGVLTPEQVTIGSDAKVWWLYPYDDPQTGQHHDFEWQTAIKDRKTDGSDNPFLSGLAVWKGFNDLASKRPDLAAQWDFELNDVNPDEVYFNSPLQMHWILPYDDPSTGKHFDFRWVSPVKNRVEGAQCPYLLNQLVYPGYNDLQSQVPEVAALWHPTKNGDRQPENTYYLTHDRLWWLYPYDDPETGRHFDFEWEGSVYDVVSNTCRCPFLSNNATWKGYNDLESKYPEVAALWHPTKNGDRRPDEIYCLSIDVVWWLYPYDDPETGRHFDFEWKGSVESVISNNTHCPFLSNTAIWRGYNDLASRYPEVAALWHPTKNGDRRPDEIYCLSGDIVWWLYPYDDPETGRHFDFEWEGSVDSVASSNTHCPFLSNSAIWKGYNDLASRYPEVAALWHPTKNGDRRPDEIYCLSNDIVWWLYPYDDMESGRHFDFEWYDTVAAVVKNQMHCPFLSNSRVWSGYNDLKSKFPEIADDWHPDRNFEFRPENVYAYSSGKFWWKCRNCGHSWRTSVLSRTRTGSECPQCRKNHFLY